MTPLPHATACILPALVLCAILVTPGILAQQSHGDPGTAWNAYWVWGSENMHGGTGFFRLAFEVRGAVDSAVLQGSGDDGYTLYLNGEELRRGGFGFNRTDRTDVTARLRQGRNVLAALCGNAAYPGGWLAQLDILYADGTRQQVVSDEGTRFHHQEIAGWNQVDFDDRAWENCQTIAKPPAGIWGPLPLDYTGPRTQLKLLDASIPGTIRAGETLAVSARFRVLEDPRDPVGISAIVDQEGLTLGELPQFEVPIGVWKAGQTVTVGPLSLSVTRYAPGGKAEVRLVLSRCRFEDGSDTIAREIEVSQRETVPPAPAARVADHRGAPGLFLDDQPVPPMLYLQGRVPISAEYGQMADAGYRLFSVGISLGWVGPDAYDYGAVDRQIIGVLRGAPEGYVVPRVDISAPAWWCDRYTGELITCADWTGWVDDVWGGTKHQSFASEKWRAEAGEALRRLIRHIQQSPYGDRVIGYHIATGIYGEWHLWSPEHLPDNSPSMRRAFMNWAREHYADDLQELNIAWRTQLSSFEEVQCPTQEERFAADVGVFKDLSVSRFVSDYWRALHETTVSAINHFCGIAKATTENRALTGVFYGYLTDIGWPQEGGHLAASLAFDSPMVDFFTSPHSYSHRALGEDGAFRAYPESIKLRGKLFIDEGDDRTYLAGDDGFTHVDGPEQTVAIMRREGLNVLTARVGMWWFDMYAGWFNDPALLDTAREMRDLAEQALEAERTGGAEIAVVLDPTSYYGMADWKTGTDALHLPLCNEQFRELHRIGAPFDVLLLDDLFRPRVRDYKCYVLLNTWCMTEARREELARILHRPGKVAVFAYAPGFSSNRGLSVDHMRDLTGLTFQMNTGGGPMVARWEGYARQVPGIQPEGSWGPEKSMAPRFSPECDQENLLAVWQDTGEPAAAFSEQDGWSGVYCGTGAIPAQLISWAARKAGCHLWTHPWTDGSAFYAGGGFLGIHTASAGERTFSLPWPMRVTDAVTGEVILNDGIEFSVNLPRWSTAIYRLEPAANP